MIKDEFFTLYNGVKIPKVGLGTWQSKPTDAYNAVLTALKLGYRHIDTAFAYGNEKDVGRAIRDSGIPREEIFVTTKLPAEKKGYDAAMDYFERSSKALGLGYIDLYLIHAPWPWLFRGVDCTNGNVGAWKAFVELYEAGRVKAIGVSNFEKKHIEPLIEATGVVPMVNQIRYYIGDTEPEITSYCQEKGILVEAYSPFATGRILESGTLEGYAKKLGVSIAQLCLRYCLEKGTLPLPKSVHEERIKANIDLDFEIPKDMLQELDELEGVNLKRK
ncbi:MAG: aldo/keto reductase [Bacilli bacterium]|nr:aldo/keto reductase [Bacilli bacterium]